MFIFSKLFVLVYGYMLFWGGGRGVCDASWNVMLGVCVWGLVGLVGLSLCVCLSVGVCVCGCVSVCVCVFYVLSETPPLAVSCAAHANHSRTPDG